MEDRREKTSSSENPEIQALADVLNENARIEAKKDGFSISTTLEDGVAEGGQQIQLKLSPLSSTFVGFREIVVGDQLKLYREKVEGALVREFTINGESVIRDLGTVFLQIRDERNGMINQEKTTLLTHFNELAGTSAQSRKLGVGTIYLTTFKNADDLVAIYHEDGHLNDPAILTEEYAMDYLQFFANYWLLPDYILNGNEPAIKNAVYTWNKVMIHEGIASINGIQKIKRSNEKIKFFKNDENFLRAKKSLQVALLTYLNEGRGIYKREWAADDPKGNEKIARMIDLG